MADKFKAGDAVQLNVGGPVMAVDSISGETYWCIWFAGKKRERAPFNGATLKAAKAEEE
jgi:uncharacterized protein YodC (DUF2158 family)